MVLRVLLLAVLQMWWVEPPVWPLPDALVRVLLSQGRLPSPVREGFKRCTLPITALRLTPPSCAAIWLALRPFSP